MDMVVKSDDSPSFTVEPSSFLSTEFDRNYTQYFLRKVVPLLSTTKQWNLFWSSIVPQASWHNQSIHHAMVALAATYESSISGINRSNEIIRQSNLAIRAFTDRHVSPDIALIICRLFSSMAQCTGNWETALIHMQSGGKILMEESQISKTNGEIAKLMAPTFLCVTENKIGYLDALERIPWTKRASLSDLETIHSEYGKLLRSLGSQKHWRKIGSSNTSFLLISWSIMTQVVCSMMYPDIVMFTAEDPIVPATQVGIKLLEAGALLSLDELKTTSRQLFDDLRDFFRQCQDGTVFCANHKPRLKRCVENFVVQAAEVEPRMTAGTFWLEEGEEACAIDEYLQHAHPGADVQSRAGGSRCRVSSLSQIERPPIRTEDSSREQREYYLEYVCPYRSGFIPAFTNRT
ncbi:hypothetical protein A1O3_00555 [Capronia epimyces CBS 606.96]|uniref:Transcription factor domain-containing protein n=1 Tax=Capronia epimyces CBS 606.96 TaxID=1182542 RepID=W9YQR6_9EURO|nr:uncharacterized protein A1O3_00555 [Capronia epimyces CBS 606.96]EXJ92005.1 hypothetical protein A1O3_00555 [Capronia epimyces CBS 606.96]